MASGPQPVSIADELLTLILAQAEQTTALLGLIRDRLPESAPVVAGEPERIELREPAPPKSPADTSRVTSTQQPQPARRRGRPPKTPRES